MFTLINLLNSGFFALSSLEQCINSTKFLSPSSKNSVMCLPNDYFDTGSLILSKQHCFFTRLSDSMTKTFLCNKLLVIYGLVKTFGLQGTLSTVLCPKSASATLFPLGSHFSKSKCLSKHLETFSSL